MRTMDYAIIAAGAVAGGGFFGPLLLALASLTKNFLLGLFDLVLSVIIIKKEINDSNLAEGIIGYFIGENSIHGANTADRYFLGTEFVKPLGEFRQIVMNRPARTWKLFRHHGWPVLWIPHPDKPDLLFYIRGTLDFVKLARTAEDLLSSTWKDLASKVKKFRVYRHYGSLGEPKILKEESSGTAPKGGGPDPGVQSRLSVCWKEDELGQDTEGCQMSDICLRPELVKVVKRIRFWHGRRDWYRDRGLAHRFGIGFYGAPGTGKTTLARAIGEDLDLPVHIFDLSSMTNRCFYEAWQKSRNSGPRMVLLEDFDTTFEGRINIGAGGAPGALTFDTVLNVISGIEREDGLLLVLTTNHIDKIDEAMGVPRPDANGNRKEGDQSTRPGRINLVVEVKCLDKAGREKMAARIIRDPELEARVVTQGAADTADQFEDRCTRESLAAMWGDIDAVGEEAA